MREEHGYTGGETVVKDAVRAWKQSHQEVFLPLSHPPGEAQVDFVERSVFCPPWPFEWASYRSRGCAVRLFRRGERKKLEGFVYPVLGPGGEGEMWIARSVTGRVAHGRTPEGAVERLRSSMEALAHVEGKSLRDWRESQGPARSRFLRMSELLQT